MGILDSERGRVVDMILGRIIFQGVLRPGVAEGLRHAGFAIGLNEAGVAGETESRVHVALGSGGQNGFVRRVD